MSYINNNLFNGERIVFLTKLHWIVFLWPIIWFLVAFIFFWWGDFAIALGVFLLCLQYPQPFPHSLNSKRQNLD